ncbi:hypothetical protein WOB87_09690 [Vibrio parahaemolyticus]|uniref:hypothetical protein n=1 Tax=Vibrio parahaemolyticus TaxID=670 RepID=UPI00112059D7|nr:hypothetical protein [Vibrio parahaemolyticus]
MELNNTSIATIDTSLVVTPKDMSVMKGLEQQFIATAYLSDENNLLMSLVTQAFAGPPMMHRSVSAW